MLRLRRPLLFTPLDPSTEENGSTDVVTFAGAHAAFCGYKEEDSIEIHGRTCQSLMGLYECYSDPTGGLHDVAIERVAQYWRGTYDAEVARAGHDSTHFVRIIIDPHSTGDPEIDDEQGLCLTSGEARQMAAVLIDQADRIDGIRPNTD